MIKRIGIKNFRSIKDLQVEIKPITVLYGQNASGKSSILYAPFILKNVVLNPNQTVDGFANLLFCNLGGFEQIVFKHKADLNIEIEVAADTRFGELYYGIVFGKKEGRFKLKLDNKLEEVLTVSFPYSVSPQKKVSAKINERTVELRWNGITVSAVSAEVRPSSIEEELLKSINSIIELIKKIDIVPLKRGFSKPVYSPVQMTTNIISEDELATLLTGGYGYLKNKVHTYVKKIFGKDFQLTSPPGTSIFYLQTVDEHGLTSEVVNEGFGINQTIYLLAKVLNSDTTFVLIEEPEIHLHPTAQNKLVEALIDIVEKEEKTLVISTHSEHIVSSLLSFVAEGRIDPEKIACYLCKMKRDRTVLQRQRVNKKGQIEGGLTSFMESEVEMLKKIIG